jgi:oligopeptide/dipeptide ABC transporter ATP-binding protein
MELLAGAAGERNMGLILITHDLGVVADVADRIAVMYAGGIVETADVHELYARPAHPYTKGLLESIPRLDQKGQTLAAIGGLPPNLMRIPPGCRSTRAATWLRTSAAGIFPRCTRSRPAGSPPATSPRRSSMPEVILSAQDLVKHYPIKTRGILQGAPSGTSRPSTA